MAKEGFPQLMNTGGAGGCGGRTQLLSNKWM